MVFEIGKSVMKLAAMIIGGCGSIYLISLGYVEAGALGIGSIVGFAVGDYNGNRNKEHALDRLQPEEIAPKSF